MQPPLRADCFSGTTDLMAKSILVIPKKRGRGRPATGRDPVTAIRLSPDLRKAIDGWSAKQDDMPSRSEAIRRLVEQALAIASPGRRPKAESVKATAMARQELDRAVDDGTAAPEERERRKRRLLKGPTEFREMRGDGGRSRPKGE
jgi:Arc/MetJ-type ribon-helix-helix transcriptional regulator